MDPLFVNGCWGICSMVSGVYFIQLLWIENPHFVQLNARLWFSQLTYQPAHLMAEPICLWTEKTTDHNYIVNPLQMSRHLILLTDHVRLGQTTQWVTHSKHCTSFTHLILSELCNCTLTLSRIVYLSAAVKPQWQAHTSSVLISK